MMTKAPPMIRLAMIEPNCCDSQLKSAARRNANAMREHALEH